MGMRALPATAPAKIRHAPGSSIRYPRLLLAVKLVWGAFLGYSLFRLNEEPFLVVAAGVVIATAALLPGYLWAQGRAPGLPILPLSMLTLLWTFALPLIAGHPEIADYGADDIQFAAICVIVYAVSATVVWLLVSSQSLRKRTHYYVLPEDRGFAFLVTSIFLGGIFIAAAVGQMISLDPGVFGILRSTILALASIALFILAARLGRGELNRVQHFMFITAVAFYLGVQLTTVFLVGSIVSVASALIGFTIGRQRVPWFTIILSVVIFAFLHNGKAEMRERYWSDTGNTLKIYEVPAFFAEWLVAGAREIGGVEQGSGIAPLHERLSLMHMLLFAQRSAPDQVPFLGGETYAIVPRLLIPRIFDADKPDSHQGTTILNVHFGIQTFEDTERTAIGWGMLNEGYANFGVAGVAGVGALLGLLFGFIGRLTARAPVMSLEGMIGITFCAIAIQAEFTMALFATVLFQSLVALALVVPFLKKQRANETG